MSDAPTLDATRAQKRSRLSIRGAPSGAGESASVGAPRIRRPLVGEEKGGAVRSSIVRSFSGVTLLLAANHCAAPSVAASTPPRLRVEASTRAVEQAREAVRSRASPGAPYLELAEEQLSRGRALVTGDDYERGAWELSRAEADATLAVALEEQAMALHRELRELQDEDVGSLMRRKLTEHGKEPRSR